MAEPSRLRKRLGEELRGARTLAGLTQRQLAEQLSKTSKVSQATVVRIEAGEGGLLSRDRVNELLDICQASEETRDRVITLSEAAHSTTTRWAEARGNATDLQGVAAEIEENTVHLRGYAMLWIPGLVQTAEYARQQLPQVDPEGTLDPVTHLAGRMERQLRLYDPGRRFDFLLEEAALRWSPGVGVKPAQLDRLLSVATLANVEVGVLPSDRVGASGWHPFEISQLVDGTVVVMTEMVDGLKPVVEPEDVARYVELWKRLWGAALVGDAAAEFIRGIV